MLKFRQCIVSKDHISMNNGDNFIKLQDNFLTLRRLSVCNLLNLDDYVLKAGFHRLWLNYILPTYPSLKPPSTKHNIYVITSGFEIHVHV